MAGKTVAVYDSSESYIRQLLKYLNQKKEGWLEITGFTDTAALKEFLDRKPVDILLFSMEELVDEEEDSEEGYADFIRHKNVKEFIYLGERRNSKSRLRHINKYQSIKKILAELQEILLPRADPHSGTFADPNADVLLVGIYDPAQKGESIHAALDIAEELSMQKETLFIDFDRFPLIASITDSPGYGSVSDLIYYYKTNPERLREGLEEKRQRYHNLDFLTGPEDREDMSEIPEKEWPGFLKGLGAGGGYEAVVVYMSEAFSDLEFFFDCCAQVFLPAYEDEDAVQKMYLFAKFLYNKGRQDLFEKVQNICISDQMPEEAQNA